jgi:hypothetical protein
MPPPPLTNEPPTRPVPVIRPHVFYFDDLTPRAGANRNGHGGPVIGPAGDRAKEEHNDALPPPTALATPLAASLRPARGRRKPFASRALAAAAASIALAAVAVAVAVTHSGNRATAPPIAVTRPTTAPTTGPVNERTTRPVSRPTTTAAPTTVRTSAAAAPLPAVLLSESDGTATYQLTSASAAIVIKATGRCWTEVRAGSPLGKVVYEGTLLPGQRFPVTGPAWVRLGDPPYVALTVNGSEMKVPGSAQGVPLNVEFTLR